ncbi:hypothetical protein DFH09DRAFT_1098227 [Mycena vulgaris]|nr:hypothetical protein DFH09DRAFT_1098227 [Mycena vulgaris]
MSDVPLVSPTGAKPRDPKPPTALCAPQEMHTVDGCIRKGEKKKIQENVPTITIFPYKRELELQPEHTLAETKDAHQGLDDYGCDALLRSASVSDSWLGQQADIPLTSHAQTVLDLHGIASKNDDACREEREKYLCLKTREKCLLSSNAESVFPPTSNMRGSTGSIGTLPSLPTPTSLRAGKMNESTEMTAYRPVSLCNRGLRRRRRLRDTALKLTLTLEAPSRTTSSVATEQCSRVGACSTEPKRSTVGACDLVLKLLRRLGFWRGSQFGAYLESSSSPFGSGRYGETIPGCLLEVERGIFLKVTNCAQGIINVCDAIEDGLKYVERERGPKTVVLTSVLDSASILTVDVGDEKTRLCHFRGNSEKKGVARAVLLALMHTVLQSHPRLRIAASYASLCLCVELGRISTAASDQDSDLLSRFTPLRGVITKSGAGASSTSVVEHPLDRHSNAIKLD